MANTKAPTIKQLEVSTLPEGCKPSLTMRILNGHLLMVSSAESRVPFLPIAALLSALGHQTLKLARSEQADSTRSFITCQIWSAATRQQKLESQTRLPRQPCIPVQTSTCDLSSAKTRKIFKKPWVASIIETANSTIRRGNQKNVSRHYQSKETISILLNAMQSLEQWQSDCLYV